MTDTEDELNFEPLIGQHVNVRIYERDEIINGLWELQDKYNMEPMRSRERVEIAMSDVDYGTVGEISMNKDVFETIVEWYCQNHLDVPDNYL